MFNVRVLFFNSSFSSRAFTQNDLKSINNNVTDNNETLSNNEQDVHELQLTEIQITTGNIRSIGTDAFADLLHLEQLSLSKNQINFIHPYAFRMNKSSNLTLMIDLTDNDLNSTSFVPESFLDAKRFVCFNFVFEFD